MSLESYNSIFEVIVFLNLGYWALKNVSDYFILKIRARVDRVRRKYVYIKDALITLKSNENKCLNHDVLLTALEKSQHALEALEKKESAAKKKTKGREEYLALCLHCLVFLLYLCFMLLLSMRLFLTIM